MHNFRNSSSDHRNLLGLFKLSTLSPLQQPFTTIRSALKLASFYTIPYIQTVWNIYCTKLHTPPPPSQLTTRPHHRTPRVSSHAPRVIVLSGNNATMSLQTVNDHIPTLYTRKTRRKIQPTPSTSSNTLPLCNSSKITNYFPLTQPVQHSQLPTHTSPLTNPTPIHSPFLPRYTPLLHPPSKDTVTPPRVYHPHFYPLNTQPDPHPNKRLFQHKIPLLPLTYPSPPSKSTT